MLDFFINRLQKLKADKNGSLAENFNALDLALAGKITANNGSDLIAGYISGNLLFNSTSTPPIVSAGLRNVTGYPVQEPTNVSLATTDAFGVCSQSFSDYLYCWMKVIVDKDGNYKYIPSYDSLPVGSLTDVALNDIGGGTTISVTGGVATVYTTNTTSLTAGHMVIVKDSTIGYLIGKVTSVSGGISFTVKTNAGNGNYTGGTYSAKYRIATLHGTGSLTGVNSDADIITYSPSPSENLIFRGFYRDIDGDLITDSTGVWRDIGGFYIDGSGNVQVGTVISYKSGFDKNDNEIRADGYAGYGLTDTMVIYLTNYRRLWGDDYTAISNSTNGFICKVVTPNTYEFSFYSYIANVAQGFGITLNDTELTTPIQSTVNYQNVMQGEDGDGDGVSFSISRYFVKDDLLRVRSNGAAPLNTNLFGIGFRQVG